MCAVPLAAGAAVELDEAHAALDQPAGQQAVAPECRRLVSDRGRRASAWPFGFRVEIDRLRRFGLHAEGEFVTADAGFEFGLLRAEFARSGG